MEPIAVTDKLSSDYRLVTMANLKLVSIRPASMGKGRNLLNHAETDRWRNVCPTCRDRPVVYVRGSSGDTAITHW